MQPRLMSVVNRQGVEDTRLEGEVAPEFSTYVVFPLYTAPSSSFWLLRTVLNAGERANRPEPARATRELRSR
jgi:hypothetical protein